MTPNVTNLSDLSDVFKTHPRPAVVKDMLSKYRTLAKKHLQETIPGKIEKIESLMASENDESSPMYSGKVDGEEYVVKMFQPTDPEAKRFIGPNDKFTLPSDIIRTRGWTGDEEVGHGREEQGGEDGEEQGEETTRGVRDGSHWFEVVTSNKNQHELINLSQHEDLHMISQDMRIWLELEIPKIEDGNSFGAEVQEHMIKELVDAYKKSNAFHNGIRSHYTDRIKLAQDWVKFPNIIDYPAAISASDRFDHFLLRSYLRSLLIIYGGLLTKFEKNWSKVINPKGSSQSGGMY